MSYIGVVKPIEPTRVLLGGTRLHISAPFECETCARMWMYTVMNTNAGCNRACEGTVQESRDSDAIPCQHKEKTSE